MFEIVLNLFYLLSRYVHVVATTLLVGGTLFYEMVVPLAIGELKTEQQLAVFARMRWVFRWVVYTSAIALILTGSVSVYRNGWVLTGEYEKYLVRHSSEQAIRQVKQASIFNHPKPWLIAHLVASGVALLVAVLLVSGGRPPDRPLQWMRLSLLALLIAMLLASASRNARQRLFEVARTGESLPAGRD
jgi:hypothetical protein